MARRGGLGRGLDALIPDRRSGKPANSVHDKAEEGSDKNVENPAGEPLPDHREAETDDPLNEGSAEASGDHFEETSEGDLQDVSENDFDEAKGKVSSEHFENNSNGYGESSSGEMSEGSFKDPNATAMAEEGLPESNPLEEEHPVAGISEEAPNSENAEAFSSEELHMDFEAVEGEASEVRNDQVVKMRISLVEPNREQPRKYFDDQAIEELSDSIRQFGIIQPLLVQKKEDYFEIIAGERRWRAAKKAGLKEVPVIVKNFSNQEAVEVSLIENIQREDLNPIEEAKAYDRLVREYGLSQEAVAGRVSKSRSSVTNSLRLLKLESSVQQMVETGQISEGHARAILGLPAPSVQKEMAEQVIKAHLSVRQTEKMVRDIVHPKAVSEEKEKDKDKEVLDEAVLRDIEEKLKLSLGTRVRINQSGKKGGRIEIEYYSFDELDRLFELLRNAHEM